MVLILTVYYWLHISLQGSKVSEAGAGGGIDVGDVFSEGAGGTILNDPRVTQAATYGFLAQQFGGPATVTIQLNAVGLSGFSVSYAAGDLGGGTQVWKWSTDDSAWQDPVSSSLGINSSTWSLNSVNISSAAGSTLYFQDTISSGAVAFDNCQVTAVPEPINYALAGFGLCVGGISFGRRFVRKLTRT